MTFKILTRERERWVEQFELIGLGREHQCAEIQPYYFIDVLRLQKPALL